MYRVNEMAQGGDVCAIQTSVRDSRLLLLSNGSSSFRGARSTSLAHLKNLNRDL